MEFEKPLNKVLFNKKNLKRAYEQGKQKVENEYLPKIKNNNLNYKNFNLNTKALEL